MFFYCLLNTLENYFFGGRFVLYEISLRLKSGEHFVLRIIISVERLHTVEDTEQICELLLKNVDAMASGAEIIIGPFCIQTDRTCFVDYDGFFVRGYRQYF